MGCPACRMIESLYAWSTFSSTNKCGFDTHRTFVVACITSANFKSVTSYKSHRFSTYTKGLKDLLHWLISHDCKDVSMESTSKYWISVYNVLGKTIVRLSLPITNMLRMSVKKLTCFKSSEKNHLQNCFTFSNIQMRNIVSDIFDKSAQVMLDKILENSADTFFDFTPLVFKSWKRNSISLWYYWWLYYTGIGGQT